VNRTTENCAEIGGDLEKLFMNCPLIYHSDAAGNHIKGFVTDIFFNEPQRAQRTLRKRRKEKGIEENRWCSYFL
jgi:hypothetical protein